jgi:hypothetical protein
MIRRQAISENNSGFESQKGLTVMIFGRWELAVADDVYIRNGTNIAFISIVNCIKY